MDESWYDRIPDRLEEEKTVMHDRFAATHPSLGWVEDDLGEEFLGWDLTITSDSGVEYTVLIVYPDNYPTEAPEPYILEPNIEPSETKHMYSDGILCLFHRDDRAWEYESTAATMTARIGAWITAYENWVTTGYWPGDEKEH
jgi:ubiquitin-protein ligase